MKSRLLFSTAVGLIFTTAAFAQSPSATTTSPSTQQTQSPGSSSTPAQKSRDTTNNQSPSAGSSTTQPAQAQTNNPTSATGGQAQAPASGTATNTAAQPTTTNDRTQAPSNNTAQTPSTNNAAQTPNTTAQSPSTNVKGAVNINDQQRTRIAQSISRLNVQPVNHVNFSLTVGTSVPRDIRLQTLPPDVVEVVPQYRGYSFFVVHDDIVIVEPSTYQIVTVLPRSGGSTAAAPAPARSKASFTDKDRDVVRKHVRTRTTERQTIGSSARTVIRRGERLPESIEMEEFPDVVYEEAPSLRDYRYIHRENRIYLVDPRERTVIEEID